MGEAHNALKWIHGKQNHQSPKAKAPPPRQAKGNGARSEILPLNPRDRAKDSSKSCSGRRTNPNNITDSLKHIVLDLPQELLGTWVTWKLPWWRESNTAPNIEYPKNNPTGRFPACETCDFKLYTDKISFEYEARNAFLSFSCFLHFPWSYPLTNLQC